MGVAERHRLVDHLGDVGGLDVILEPLLLEVPLEHVGAESAVPLVDGHRDELEPDGGPAAQVIENVKHGVRILAAGHAAQDPIAVLDELEVLDRPADPARERLEKTARRGRRGGPATAAGGKLDLQKS